ncbi:a1-alpha2 repression [Phytophthora pseudosyringae]|uniref:A1-alpha2 repression n=1 Tax=Phytophthora pseudosyringae TaxID=221518 RepID=A0A8T1VB92_9STRA|nr:a1-alpha2 repression [Phytophthora pseudosyringae]
MRGSLYPDVPGQSIRLHLHDRAFSIDDDAAADLFSHVLLDAEQGRPKASSSGVSGADVGSFLVCLDILTAPEFGEDYRVFPTGPQYQGATFLPLGLHMALLRSREQKYGFWQDFFVATHKSLCASGACRRVMSVAALLVSVAIALELIAGLMITFRSVVESSSSSSSADEFMFDGTNSGIVQQLYIRQQAH